MPLYVLDTDSLSLHERGNPGLLAKAQALQPGELAVTVITVEEQLSGWYTILRRARLRHEIARAYLRLATAIENFSGLTILPFPETAIARFDQLDSLRLNVGRPDLRIAAITLEYGGIVVTRNLRDFQRVPGLTVENWAT